MLGVIANRVREVDGLLVNDQLFEVEHHAALSPSVGTDAGQLAQEVRKE
jgi:hypothetical protein